MVEWHYMESTIGIHTEPPFSVCLNPVQMAPTKKLKTQLYHMHDAQNAKADKCRTGCLAEEDMSILS